MNERLILMEDDKEKLVDEILHQRDVIKNLLSENEVLRQKLEKNKKKDPKKSDNPEPTQAVAKKRSLPPHRWGRKAGHPGCTRPIPNRIDHEAKLRLSRCPDCHHSLGRPTEIRDHIQEDIIPARMEVTRFLHYRYWCGHCAKNVTAPYASDEVPHGYLGPRALATIVWLKYHMALPGHKIKDLLYDLCGFYISEGAIAQALQRLGSYLQIETCQILKAVQETSSKHVDETGWKINGVSHWLWTVVNNRWAFFHVNKSRGSKVPKELLGCPHQGTVSSDFFSAYNKLKGNKQKCLVHLKRDIHKARDAFPPHQGPPGDFRAPERKLNRLLQDAQRLANRRGTFSPLVFARRVRRLKQRLFDFGAATYSHAFWQTMSGRILKHVNELFTFLEKPGVSPDNNAAERAIRPHVIIRNRSFQNRTPKGALAHERLSSLLQTLLLQKRNIVDSLRTAYPKHRQGNQSPLLFPQAAP